MGVKKKVFATKTLDGDTLEVFAQHVIDPLDRLITIKVIDKGGKSEETVLNGETLRLLVGCLHNEAIRDFEGGKLV